AVLEEVLHQVVFAVGAVLLERPDVFLGTQCTVVAVEAPDPAFAIFLVAPVLGGRSRRVNVRVDDEILLPVLLVHRAPLSPRPASADRRTVCPSPPVRPAKSRHDRRLCETARKVRPFQRPGGLSASRSGRRPDP